MKQYFEAVPVNEAPEKPSNGDVIPVITDLGNAYFTARGAFIDDNEEEIDPKWWLRPLSLAVPESVSEVRIACDKILTEQKKDKNHICTTLSHDEEISFNTGYHRGVENCYHYLLPLLASRDEEVKALKMQADLDNVQTEGLMLRLRACESALEKRDEELTRLREQAELDKVTIKGEMEFSAGAEKHLNDYKKLRDAVKYYFDVLEEVRGKNWDKNPDHVLGKLLTAYNTSKTAKNDTP